jgi:hypothetical protein
MSDEGKKRDPFVVTDQSADVHVITDMPDALATYAKQLVHKRPTSVHQLVSANAARIQRAKDKQLPVLVGAYAYAGVSLALLVPLLLVIWMISGPIKCSILFATVAVIWVWSLF